MATGAHDFVRPPPPSTPHSSSIRFPRGLAARGKTRAEPRCDACGETFQIGPNTQVRMVRKRGTERTALAFQRSAQVGIGTTYNGMRRRSAVGAGWGIGTYTTLAPLDEPKRWQLGPTILFDRPRPAPPTPPPSDFPVGWPLGGRREQSRGAMRAGKLFKSGPTRRCGW